MKKLISVLLASAVLCLAGCGSVPEKAMPQTTDATEAKPLTAIEQPTPADPAIKGEIVDILLDEETVTVNGEAAARRLRRHGAG